MAKKLSLKANERSDKLGVLRRAEQVPGILYGHNLDNQDISVDRREFRQVLSHAGYTSLIALNVAGGKEQEHTVLIREVQTHPVRDTILHVDFYQPRLDRVIRAHVPLHFTGESPAVEDLGGVFVRPLEEVDLEALPADLPHDIEVDISQLKDFDTTIHVSDLKLPDGVKLYHEDDEVVALVQPPRTEEEIEADLAEEVTEDVDSVEGVEDKPEEGDEEATDQDASDEAKDTDANADHDQ